MLVIAAAPNVLADCFFGETVAVKLKPVTAAEAVPLINRAAMTPSDAASTYLGLLMSLLFPLPGSL